MLEKWGRAVTVREMRKAWGRMLAWSGGRKKGVGDMGEGIRLGRAEKGVLRMWGVLGGRRGRDLGKGWRSWTEFVREGKRREERERERTEIRRLAIRGVFLRENGKGKGWAWNMLALNLKRGKEEEKRLEDRRVGLTRWVKAVDWRGIRRFWVRWRADVVRGSGEVGWEERDEERRRRGGMKVALVWRRGEGRVMRRGWMKWRGVVWEEERKGMREEVKRRVVWGALLR